ncbi:MAG: hypothetical protein QHD01_02925 [Bradyrhizobium sp.]|uniref:hypothetical protein n=1 Tax=Bradyrhizobium sp. TaxID=376 RepID=UPI0029AF2EEC|nr:hypothetical protein [Bradyrhizobium sp.]MDX3965538.1 hypothetical protein [Bradyrhizobium sp.]
MKAKTYTMTLADEVVAQGVTVGRALVLALEHGGPHSAALIDRDLGNGPQFHIGRRTEDGRRFIKVHSVNVARSGDAGIDTGLAIEFFEKTLLENTGVLWPGRVETDLAYARRRGRPRVGEARIKGKQP